MLPVAESTSAARAGALRHAIGVTFLVAVAGAIVVQTFAYLTRPDVKRPHDFLQVWSAGRLTLEGKNPYDAKTVLDLQLANGSPRPFASMMWVPPWGVALALPIGALPVAAAEAVWVFGQVGLIVLSATIVWRLNGGRPGRWWAPVVLALASGPMWWQTFIGQYAGILLLGLVGYLAAHRANRPVLAGLCLTLIALKPHLFLLPAVGFVIDALRTQFGRRVVLGGAIGLAIGALAASLASPSIWSDYLAAVTGESSPYAPSIRVWFNPTIPAWIRHVIPGRPFWVQTLPAVFSTVVFAAYWWLRGNPSRWPAVLNWVVPAGLLLAPYGSWPSDLTLLLIPTVALAARVDARGWAVPGRQYLLGAYGLANAGVLLMYLFYSGTGHYVWVGPVLCGCLLWLRMGIHPRATPVVSRGQSSPLALLQPQTAS